MKQSGRDGQKMGKTIMKKRERESEKDREKEKKKERERKTNCRVSQTCG